MNWREKTAEFNRNDPSKRHVFVEIVQHTDAVDFIAPEFGLTSTYRTDPENYPFPQLLNRFIAEQLSTRISGEEKIAVILHSKEWDEDRRR